MSTPGFKIRPYTMADVDAITKHANDYDVARYLSEQFPSPYLREDAIAWIHHTQEFYPLRNMTIEVNGEAAGDIGLTLTEGIYRSSVEFGYWLGKAFWGKGIMPRVIRQWMTYAFEHFSFYKLYARVYEDNYRSVRALEKAGVQYETTLKKHVIVDGKLKDLLYYSKFRQ